LVPTIKSIDYDVKKPVVKPQLDAELNTFCTFDGISSNSQPNYSQPNYSFATLESSEGNWPVLYNYIPDSESVSLKLESFEQPKSEYRSPELSSKCFQSRDDHDDCNAPASQLNFHMKRDSESVSLKLASFEQPKSEYRSPELSSKYCQFQDDDDDCNAPASQLDFNVMLRNQSSSQMDLLDILNMNQEPPKANKSTITSWKEVSLLEIVTSQKYDGNWEFNADNAITVNQTSNELASKIPGDIKDKADSSDIWITIVILNVLELYYEHKKGSWSMIQRKAVKWLEERGADYRKYKDAVRALY